jgi:hypothetical protein
LRVASLDLPNAGATLMLAMERAMLMRDETRGVARRCEASVARAGVASAAPHNPLIESSHACSGSTFSGSNLKPYPSEG